MDEYIVHKYIVFKCKVYSASFVMKKQNKTKTFIKAQYNYSTKGIQNQFNFRDKYTDVMNDSENKVKSHH